jgi:hypothetical protein
MLSFCLSWAQTVDGIYSYPFGRSGAAYRKSITTTLVYVNARLHIYISTLPSTTTTEWYVYSKCDIKSGLEVDQINQISSDRR